MNNKLRKRDTGFRGINLYFEKKCNEVKYHNKKEILRKLLINTI